MDTSRKTQSDVIAKEQTYLKQRRANAAYTNDELSSTSGENDTWGLAISGGGIRSATFALGVLQSLASKSKRLSKGLFRRFDYMSTVSGGGYIGSAITSLLTIRGDQDKAKAGADVDDSGFPFTSLNVADFNNPEKITVKHQMHHLRSNGNYLSTEQGVLRPSVQRLFGTAVGGILYNVVLFVLIYLFLIASIHLVTVMVIADPVGEDLSLRNVFESVGFNATNFSASVLSISDLREVWDTVGTTFEAHSPWGVFVTNVPVQRAFCWAAFLGILVGAVFCFIGRKNDRRAYDIHRMGKRFMYSVFTLFVLGTLSSGVITEMSGATLPRHTGLWVPLCFALGLCVPVLVVSLKVMHGPEGEHKRGQRSFFSTLRGYCLTSILFGLLFPTFVIILFSISRLPFTSLSLSIAALLIGATGMRLSIMSDNIIGKVGRFIQRNPRMMLGSMVMMLLAFTFAPGTRVLMAVAYNGWFAGMTPPWLPVLCTMGILGTIIAILGFVVDSNEAAPFAFYRDRLAETYLTTCTTTDNGIPGAKGEVQHTLRDDSDLALRDIGSRMGAVGTAPYHLITTAINMSGAKGLLRKDKKSEHFLFSKYFVGSTPTGYIETPEDITLGRAMAISGAAFSGLAGQFSFFGQRFFAVLLNMRLGQWMENPLHFGVERKGAFKGRSHPFWPIVLLREILGRANASSRFINVSDGGHTGDNLGLLPLLQRRCSVIVVIDGEQDPNFEFASLNNAIRFANVEENIDIDIDLSALHPVPDTIRSTQRTTASVAVGTIKYHDRPDAKLIYCKCSVSNVRFFERLRDHVQTDFMWLKNVVPGADPTARSMVQAIAADADNIPSDMDLPVHVENYDRRFPIFPHQSTGDQFFDTEQFEAYRALGEHVGQQGRVMIEALILKR
ncbi:MAG: patatin-like phospholipase family protein [bacterium]|nr:patatin-like phospholipase family protein [bacterium]